MSTRANRIKELRLRAGLKQSELAEILGIRQNTVSTWENGRYEPDNQMLIKLASCFGVSVDYLLEAPSVRMRELVLYPHQRPKNRLKIPVLGDVAAGIPIEAITDIIDYEGITPAMADTGEFFGLRIKGDSMEPRMREGDVVIVRKQDTAESGDTVVVLVNGNSATVKKIKIGPEGITLIPTNPAHDIQFYSAADVESLPVRVIGRVVELRAKY